MKLTNIIIGGITMPLSTLKTIFKDLFQTDPKTAFFAPGRVNLIGEHIDYNGGLVFPCAITKGTYAVAHKREDKSFHVYSNNFKELGVIELSLDALSFAPKDAWANYVKGILSVLLQKGYTIPFGLNLVIYGDIPNGSGLSSSASLEILLCKIFNTYYDLKLSPEQMALIGKQVENEYIGVNSGIMDQFAIALGQSNHALLLDCATQKYEYISFDMNGYELVIMNTNKRRELADSKYNERFNECKTALHLLQKHYNISNLCELNSDHLLEIQSMNLEPNLFKRAKHAITENERVLAATSALRENRLTVFGDLLCASHRSLQMDYEVTGKELDTLVETALEEGAIGARMTGAGFGGCAIALVKSTLADSLIEKVGIKYKETIGYEASFYKATVGNGPTQLI